MDGLKPKKNLFIVYLVIFTYLEFLYRFLILGTDKVFRLSNINMMIFLIAFAGTCYLLTRILSEKANKWVFCIFIAIICIWFAAQYVVKDVFSFYISTEILKQSGQLTEGVFLKETGFAILKRIPQILLFLLPFIICLIFKRKFNFAKIKPIKFFLILTLVLLVYIGNYLALNIGNNTYYSVYNLYHSINNPNLSIESTGVINTFFVDIRKQVTNFQEKIVIVKKDKTDKNSDTEEEIKYEYNNLNIDFDKLKEENSNDTITQMTEYFENEEGTLQNEYTGYFKGKNLIVFMAESFNEVAVDKELTPTLYKMVHGGFEFTNFYSPTIYSTIGGEMQELTSLYPVAYTEFKNGNIAYPMGLGNIFKSAGYNTYAYHDHTYSFQNRYIYLKDMGFDNFKACGNGLENLVTTCYGVGSASQWPESDVEMMDTTVSEWINSDEPFVAYYATVSGHGSYTDTSGKINHNIAKKYVDLVEAKYPNYSNNIKSYIAANIELDRAMESLLKQLEDAGKLDDTVIALVGDHYPYMLTTEEVNEASSYVKDGDIEVNHSNFILYNSKMDKVTVDKVGSQIDVMPTLYNLFGLKYDSRLLIGKDILSTEEGLAMFSTRSWVTDKGKYYASSHQFVANEGVIIPNGYVDTMNQIVSGKISMSDNIICNNYYNIAWKYIK